MGGQVFLGGACGATTWRREIAIPVLESAGVTYHNPQLGPGEWTPAHEVLDMEAKAAAGVLLFVISGATRGVASIAEVSYLLAAGRPLALAVEDVPPDAEFDGRTVGKSERDDLNCGRLFVRTMAAGQGVPVFADAAGAAAHAARLARGQRPCESVEQVRAVLDDVKCGEYSFSLVAAPGGFLVSLECVAPDSATAVAARQEGRRWFVPRGATRDEIVRTAFKAAVTWAEHETREQFSYQSARVFGPHLDVGRLAAAARDAGG